MSEIMSFEECVKKLKVTRDFDLYLDLLDRVKDRYLVIVCIRGHTDNNAYAGPLEKLISMGFSKYSAEPVKKYVGIMNNGQVICDDLSEFYAEPMLFDILIAVKEVPVVKSGLVYKSFIVGGVDGLRFFAVVNDDVQFFFTEGEILAAHPYFKISALKGNTDTCACDLLIK